MCYNKGMDKQMSLSAFSDELSQVRTKRDFLDKIEHPTPWGARKALIQPGYYELELMLRLYPLRNLYGLSDEKTVAEVIDIRPFSRFRASTPAGHYHPGWRK